MIKDIIYIIKRVIIGVLISIILMLIASYKVNALNYSTVYMPDHNISGTYTLSAYNSYITLNTSNRPFANMGSGTIIFSFTISSEMSITSIELFSSNVAGWTCDIGTNSYYNDSNSQLQTYTAKCNVGGFGTSGLVKVRLYGFAWSLGGSVTFGQYWTSVQESPSSNYSQDISNVYNAINNSATQDRQIAEQAHNDAQDIKNSVNNNTESINEVNNTLKDESTPSNDDLESILNNKSNNNNVSNLVMFVPNIFASVGTGLSSNCNSSIQLGNLLGTNLQLTCIRPQNYIGNQLWTIIDFMFLFGLFLAFRKWVVNIYNDLTSLKEVKFQ